MRALVILGFILPFLAACVEPAQVSPTSKTATIPSSASRDGRQIAQDFIFVVETIEPIAEAECRRRGLRACDFRIVIDDRRGEPPNAFQTVDDNGRPVIGFTIALLANIANRDEMAFVLSHEASHHILRHLEQQNRNANAGAAVFGNLASMGGGSQNAIAVAQQLGASVGARSFSKEFELEADRLGTVIAHRGGFDPVRGAAFFNRLPDPGDRFLGTHPPNADRIAIVRRTAAGL